MTLTLLSVDFVSGLLSRVNHLILTLDVQLIIIIINPLKLNPDSEQYQVSESASEWREVAVLMLTLILGEQERRGEQAALFKQPLFGNGNQPVVSLQIRVTWTLWV